MLVAAGGGLRPEDRLGDEAFLGCRRRTTLLHLKEGSADFPSANA